MPGRGKEKPKESIRTYFGTRAFAKAPEQNISSVSPDGENDENFVQENMADSEVVKLIKALDTKLSAQATNLDKLTCAFEGLNANISKLTDKVESLEFVVEEVKQAQKDDRATIQDLREEINTLKSSLLATQAYARKYHLILYGVEGHETESSETIAKVRDFAKRHLKLDSEYADNITIRNAHRLQKRQQGPATIVVVFLFWNERQAFLQAGPNLRGSKMRVATDLPPELKKKRGQLASIAFEIRRDEELQTRIREKGAEVWLETRKDKFKDWKKRTVDC